MAMKRVPAKGTTVKGTDVSHWQKSVDFRKLKSRGYEFVFIKASESLREDIRFREHREKAKAAGMLVGAYCYFHTHKDPIAQAEHFCKIMGKLGPGDLDPVIDWESDVDAPNEKDRVAVLKFCAEVKRRTGRNPIIYTGPYFAQAHALDARFKQFPLWVAHYKTDAPLVPAPWTVWSFHQYSDHEGAVSLDQNRFNGPLENLRKFAGYNTPAIPAKA